MSSTRLQNDSYREIVSVSVDTDLLNDLDDICKKLGVKRSVFVRSVLRWMIEQLRREGM